MHGGTVPDELPPARSFWLSGLARRGSLGAYRSIQSAARGMVSLIPLTSGARGRSSPIWRAAPCSIGCALMVRDRMAHRPCGVRYGVLVRLDVSWLGGGCGAYGIRMRDSPLRAHRSTPVCGVRRPPRNCVCAAGAAALLQVRPHDLPRHCHGVCRAYGPAAARRSVSESE